ncbi:MAG: phosphoribosylformylglycinamidine synthase subunit PurL [Solirubrobacterales bacterium]
MTAKPLWQEMGLKDDEYQKVLEIMGREPNRLELGMFSVMWSEHCGYKSSRPVLKLFPTTGERVIQGPGENAGVVDIGDGQALVFKIESHNHPSAIEPYQGAATGVGGIVRDIFTMGARPIAMLNSLRFGPLDDDRTRHLFAGVVSGIGGYGNCLGIPTVAGEVYFHPSYKDNPLVNAMCVGLVKADEIALAIAGDVGRELLLVGARTGRDGIHGATFASEELSEESESKRPSVQVGDPFMEKLLLEACLELIHEDLAAGMQDLGAAGLTSSISEAANKGGRGVEVDVLKVPRREEGMTPYEVMLSESQERMLVVPREGKVDRIQEIFEKWGLEAAIIGHITDDGMFRVTEGGVVAGEVPVNVLTEDCPVYQRPYAEPAYFQQVRSYDLNSVPVPADAGDVLRQLLGSPSIASKEWVYTQYDYEVMTNTTIKPGDADGAVLRIKGTPKGAAVTVDCNSRFCYLDPFKGGLMTVAEAALNLACLGAEPLAMTNCLNFGNPEKPEVFWQFRNAILGMAEAAKALKTPVVSGNVSLYNETRGGEAVFPTPTVGMVGLLPDISKRMRMAFTGSGDDIVLLGGFRDEIGGSEYLALIHGLETGAVPDLDLPKQQSLIELLLDLIGKGQIKSAHDLSEGGLAVAVAEAAIEGGIGAVVNLTDISGRPDGLLFGEAPGRVIISVKPEDRAALLAAAQNKGVAAAVIGQTGGDRLIIQAAGIGVNAAIDEIKAVWQGAIRCIMQ